MGTLLFNISGISNTAVGTHALANVLANNNIGIGANAGINLETGGDNIAIGNVGEETDSGTIRIGGAVQTRTFIAGIHGVNPGASAMAVVVNGDGQLGTLSAGYIKNTTTLQAGSNFNISGNGVVGGRVGIGTAPSVPLHVSSASRNAALIESSDPIGTWLGLKNTSTGGVE